MRADEEVEGLKRDREGSRGITSLHATFDLFKDAFALLLALCGVTETPFLSLAEVRPKSFADFLRHVLSAREICKVRLKATEALAQLVVHPHVGKPKRFATRENVVGRLTGASTERVVGDTHSADRPVHV